MTKDERVKAFSMRCDGATWEQIGEALNYSSRWVADDIAQVMDIGVHVSVIYPNIWRYMVENCSGSVEVFAQQMRTSPYRLRLVLVHGAEPTERVIQLITEATGMSADVAFQKEEL